MRRVCIVQCIGERGTLNVVNSRAGSKFISNEKEH